MRKFTYILLGLTFCLCATSSCSLQKNKEHENVRILMKDSVENSLPQKMPKSESKINLNYKGKAYVSIITRRPDERQALVKNQQGDTFIDNLITLHIKSDDKTIVNKEFVKTDFASLINARFMNNAILENLIYTETTTEGFVYVASISYPQSDLYVPIKLTVTPNGNIKMEKEELLDSQEIEDIPE